MCICVKGVQPCQEWPCLVWLEQHVINKQFLQLRFLVNCSSEAPSGLWCMPCSAYFSVFCVAEDVVEWSTRLNSFIFFWPAAAPVTCFLGCTKDVPVYRGLRNKPGLQEFLFCTMCHLTAAQNFLVEKTVMKWYVLTSFFFFFFFKIGPRACSSFSGTYCLPNWFSALRLSPVFAVSVAVLGVHGICFAATLHCCSVRILS